MQLPLIGRSGFVPEYLPRVSFLGFLRVVPCFEFEVSGSSEFCLVSPREDSLVTIGERKILTKVDGACAI